MWTFKEAKEFLKNIRPLLKKASLKAEIIGSVKIKKYSEHDLDLKMVPTKRIYKFKKSYLKSVPKGIEPYEYSIGDLNFDPGKDAVTNENIFVDLIKKELMVRDVDYDEADILCDGVVPILLEGNKIVDFIFGHE